MVEDIKLDKFQKEAIDFYLRLGFTPEVICNRIEFGCLNVDSSEVRKIFNVYKRRGKNGRRHKTR